MPNSNVARRVQRHHEGRDIWPRSDRAASYKAVSLKYRGSVCWSTRRIETKTATFHPVFERPDRSARVIRRVTTKEPDEAERRKLAERA
jgi:hypothetical protein